MTCSFIEFMGSSFRAAARVSSRGESGAAEDAVQATLSGDEKCKACPTLWPIDVDGSHLRIGGWPAQLSWA